MRRLRTRGARVAAMVTIGVFAAAVPSGVAVAKISPPSCETSSGQQPPGQQPVCNGGGLEQQPAKNPSGNAPPGQQP